ncbi:MAG: hydroxyacid dehydrogenase [Gammaproteobacteria bacterium]|nr:hydroxyacid dehydrogenase [Gammaproteobacteria bacterium]
MVMVLHCYFNFLVHTRLIAIMSTQDHIIIVNQFHPETLERLDSNYQTHHLWKLRHPEKNQLLESLEGHCRVAATASWMCDPIIYRLRSLELIAAFGVGVDGVDLETTQNLNIRVTNTPGVLDDGVADLAMALILATMRNIVAANKFSRDGQWSEGPFPFGTSMAGKTLGIAGLGRIGSAIALRAEPFKMSIAYHNRQPRRLPYTFCESLEDLARISDVLVCVLPGGDETDNLINASVLKELGPSGILINVGRGNSIDDDALIDSLRSGSIKAAGLDVYKNEPQIPDAYKTLDNVILLPHIGSATEETRRAMGHLVLDNIEAFLQSGTLISEVK